MNQSEEKRTVVRSIDGVYTISGRSLAGKLSGTVELAIKDGVLTGLVKSGEHRFTLKDGLLRGDNFSCSVKEKDNVKVSGSVKGKKITGNIRVGLMRVKFHGEKIR